MDIERGILMDIVKIAYSKYMARMYVIMMVAGALLYKNDNIVIKTIGMALSYPMPFMITFVTGFIAMMSEMRMER